MMLIMCIKIISCSLILCTIHYKRVPVKNEISFSGIPETGVSEVSLKTLLKTLMIDKKKIEEEYDITRDSLESSQIEQVN